jgi:DNA-binding transcriptional LysR family regulator
MAVELRDVRYFQAVAEHRNLGRAAEALGLSQPALSKSLQRLEQAVGSKLFQRTPKGVELTAAGAALLGQANRLRLSINDVLREIADLSEARSGFLNIGGGPDTALDILPEALGTLLQAAPKVRSNITVLTYDELLQQVRNGELDLIVSGIESTPPEDVTQIPLHDHEFGVYASANHRLVRQNKVTLADLSREEWALAASQLLPRQHLARVFESHGLPAPRVAVETAPTGLRLRIISATNLLGFFWKGVEDRVAGRRVRQLHVPDINWKRRAGITFRKDAYLSPIARRFVEILKLNATRRNR